MDSVSGTSLESLPKIQKTSNKTPQNEKANIKTMDQPNAELSDVPGETSRRSGRRKTVSPKKYASGKYSTALSFFFQHNTR